MTNAYFYSNVAVATTTTGGINSAVTGVTVDSTAGWPGSYPYIVALDFGGVSEELVKVTNNVANVLTIVRGFGSTTAVSHSAGAVVRHVHNAVDDTDFRTHEAATAGVHGITGSFVGTTDVQTLTNKTLTTPSITNPAISGGGSLAGTFTGAPTFSGGLTFSGAPSFTGGGSLAGTFTGAPTFSGNPVFSGTPSLTGTLMGTGASILLERTLLTDSAYRTRITGDVNSRLIVNARGDLTWGGGVAVGDTNLYRSAANTLKTDDNLVVDQTLAVTSDASIGGNVTAANLQLGAWSSWTPTWTTSTGAHTPSYGNATVVGAYAKFGRTLHFTLTITFGSSTNFGSGATGSDNWIFSLPAGLTAAAAWRNQVLQCGLAWALQGASTTSLPLDVMTDTDGTSFLCNVIGGQVNGVAPSNAGVVDSITPFVWANGNTLRLNGTVECTT